jgi:hypothetical protein
VYAACDALEAKGCTFKKKPNEGRMMGLAFVYDPDGYWVEIVKRGETAGEENALVRWVAWSVCLYWRRAFATSQACFWCWIQSGIANAFNLSQTMFRIKDPSKTIPFCESAFLSTPPCKTYTTVI